MIKKSVFVLLVMVLFGSCASYDALYREPDRQVVYPSEKKVEKTFYLIGDAGLSPMDGMSDALKTLQNLIKDKDTEGDFAIYLGDNIYPDGMPPQDQPIGRKWAENHLDAQLRALEDFKGEIVFIPGNHDWYNDGLAGLRREELYLEFASGKNLLRPSGGCPLESIDLGENIQLIVIDTQWYLEDWNTDPSINENCEIKTREKFFIEVETELEKNQGKTILFAMHHPMFTYGAHGGHFALKKHLYPLQKKIPMPILASLVAQIRSQGGVSVQDRYNELYNKLMTRLATISKKSKRLVFASGHEHSMHHIEQDGLIQIQTGNGAKSSFADLGQFGEFSYGGQGFAVMDVFEDGSSWVKYYGVGDNYTPELLFQKEIIAPPKPYDISSLPKLPKDLKTISVPIYKQDSINEALFFKTVWGKKYKDVYALPVEAPIGYLDTLFGGVTVIGESSNKNFKALRLEDKDGNEYRMRTLKKNALNFLTKIDVSLDPQNVEASQETDAKEEISFPDNFDSNFYTATHPYAQMAIPVLADAIEIFNTKPRLYYIPKQERLGNYNENFGNDLYYISIQPNEDSEGQRTFEYPDDIETTDDILIKMRARADLRVDEQNYIKSRLFNMLIGDWDRESDHWRWAEYYNRDSLNVFVPIPKNQDDAFSSFEGSILDVAKSIFGSNNQKHIYSEDIRDLQYFNEEGIILDRALLKRSGRAQWIFLAETMQKTLTDSLIDAAFMRVPEEVREESLKEIIETLKARRENLVDIADRYYSYLATQQTIEGSNYNDYFEITRLPEGMTNVKVYANYKDARKEPAIDRTFRAKETREIWIYGLDGKDTFEIHGDTDGDLIFVRLIGGQGIDTYKLIEGENAKVYDHESRESNVEVRKGGSLRFTDVYNLNVYDYRKQITRSNDYASVFGYNPDDGMNAGIQFTYLVNNYQRNPFSQKHTARASYYFDTSSFDVEYNAEYANIQNDRNLSFGLYFTSPNYTVNYFGYGNETLNPEEELGIENNRVELQTIAANIGLLRNSNFGSFFKLQTKVEAIRLHSPLPASLSPNATLIQDETSYFGTLEGLYNYRSYDNPLNPTKGMMFDLSAGATDNLKDLDRIFGFLKTRLGFYNALTRNKKVVLKTNIQAGFNFDNNFEFYQGVTLGANNGLRGYREERFTGKSSLVGSADVRYSFNEFKIELIPIQVGVYGGADLGKVWVPGHESDKWHNSLGGGLWINGSGGLNGSFSAFHSVEGTRYVFGFGLTF
ncbi:metallophosphoesterase [Altibacter sp.]|uniref:metallophosphoesterase n=1 Tax=Altibacter sp. TaxID=2024823 RepID=UPI000C979287|nr:metallophosphoesterase [Altibacter sp.]MAP55547.1 phosphoesterase [Altibacter sp.]